MNQLNQKKRFVCFLLNAVTFYGVYVSLNQSWVLHGGRSVWFVAAIGWWLLGLVSAPWFRPPRDALASSAGALLVLATIDLTSGHATAAVVATRGVGMAYAATVALLALAAGWVEAGQDRSRVQRTALSLSGHLANGAVLFGFPAMVSIFGFHSSPQTQLGLVALWFGFALVRPYELIVGTLHLLRAETKKGALDPVGLIQRIDYPDIVRVKLSDSSTWNPGRLHMVALPGGETRYLAPLFSQTQDADVLGTGLCVGTVASLNAELAVGSVRPADEEADAASLMAALAGDETSELVGFVVEGSRIGSIKFEVSSGEHLEEGMVVFCRVGEHRVFFQILDANTSEESFLQHPRGTHVATAIQLGTHDDAGFAKYPWVPTMNLPVFRLAHDLDGLAEPEEGWIDVGEVPGTGIPVRVNVPELVMFHSAVLGVTGTGKTELVLDFVRAAADQGVKVVCVDLTGEYMQRLSDCEPVELGLSENEVQALHEKLFEVETGSYGAGEEKKRLRAFLDEIHGDVRTRVSEFLERDGSNPAIFQLAEVSNTRASLRATELFLTEIMLWARRNRRARSVLIVLEEAHTIIPETAGSGFDYDTQWVVSRIGQIALQGRKYGVGLMIVSQRTALVSKTILSQCNTYFVHSLVDKTSLEYLGNVLSREHLESVPNLRFLECIAHGKAVASERPILVRRRFDEDKRNASELLR